MNSKLKELEVENLFEAILCLENMEECYNFFEDLCTVTELKALSQRFQVAKMLDSGKVYSDIVATTGGQHRHHQPGQPFPQLRVRRLSGAVRPAQGKG